MAVLKGLTANQLEALNHDWILWARDDQLPADARARRLSTQRDSLRESQTIRTWLFIGGRGAGKTRAGAEWVRAQALGISPFARGPQSPIALVGETLHDVREVMVTGVSGLTTIHPDHERPQYSISRRRLQWTNGATAYLYSAQDPESLRGPQFACAWSDELAKWRYGEETWDMLQFGLRMGATPRQSVTTTARPTPLLKRLLAREDTDVTRAATQANAANLPTTFIRDIEDRYGHTPLGRQEICGDIVESNPEALWQSEAIDTNRYRTRPDAICRIIVGVDPPAGGKRATCGIVVAGANERGHLFVLDDASLDGATPERWARQVAKVWHREAANAIVCEINQGGDMVAAVLQAVDPTIPVQTVRAKKGKWIRAEPIAALYTAGRVHHIGTFPLLEEQMLAFTPLGTASGASPDRLDALVWALTALAFPRRSRPRLRIV